MNKSHIARITSDFKMDLINIVIASLKFEQLRVCTNLVIFEHLIKLHSPKVWCNFESNFKYQ